MSRKLFFCILLIFLFNLTFVDAEPVMYSSGWSCEDILNVGATCRCITERCYDPYIPTELDYKDEVLENLDIEQIKALPPPPKPRRWLVEYHSVDEPETVYTFVESAYDEEEAKEKLKEDLITAGGEAYTAETVASSITISKVVPAEEGKVYHDVEGDFLVNTKGNKIYAPQESGISEKWYIDPKNPEWAWNPSEEKWVPSSQVPVTVELEEGSAPLPGAPTAPQPQNGKPKGGAVQYPSGWWCEGTTCECTEELCYSPEKGTLVKKGKILCNANIGTIKMLPNPPVSTQPGQIIDSENIFENGVAYPDGWVCGDKICKCTADRCYSPEGDLVDKGKILCEVSSDEKDKLSNLPTAPPGKPQKGTLGAKVEGGNIYESTSVSPASSVLTAENCLSSQRCNEIDEVWLKIVAWVNSLRKELVWNTALGDWKQKARPEVTLKPGVTGAATAIRQNIKRVAEAEYARWDNGARRESELQMKPIVVSYFEAGGPNCANLNPVVDPWSAAFVSYVLKNAGVTSFPGRCSHTQYFKAVHDSPGACRTYPMSERERIGIGDVVCRCRPSETEKCSGDYNNAYGHSHCDVVVNVIGSGKVEVIGGNVNDNVEKRVLDVSVDEALDKKWYGFISCEGAAARPVTPSSVNFCVATVGTNEQKALLDTIAWAEGTREKYSVMFGGKQFTTYASHPVETGEMPPDGITAGSYTSTAAGRYQFLYTTFKDLKGQGYFQTGFKFVEQDTAALEGLIQKKGLSEEALKQAVDNNNFELIWDKLAPVWASLPYSPKGGQSYYGQPVKKSSDLVNIYQTCLQFHKTGGISIPSAPSTGEATFSACPQEMSTIDSKYCIDKWENSIYDKNNPSQKASLYYPAKTAQADSTYNYWKNGWKGNAVPNSVYTQMPERGAEAVTGFAPLAVSQANVIPNMYVSKEIAQQACANAGKRLCTEDEWVKACKGPLTTSYPYGENYVAGKCNTNQAGKYPPSVVGWDKVMPPNQYDPSDPRNGKAAVDIGGVRETASFLECSNAYGVYDMVGNLAEVVSTSASNGNALFKGSAFMRSGNNLNCNDIIGAHAAIYTDYSFGFRCCASLS